jgi:hypothetical protein
MVTAAMGLVAAANGGSEATVGWESAVAAGSGWAAQAVAGLVAAAGLGWAAQAAVGLVAQAAVGLVAAAGSGLAVVVARGWVAAGWAACDIQALSSRLGTARNSRPGWEEAVSWSVEARMGWVVEGEAVVEAWVEKE